MTKRNLRYFFADLLFNAHLEEGEHILFIGRRFYFEFFKWKFLGKIILGIFLPAMLYIAFPNLLYAWLVWGAYGVASIIYSYVDWYFDAWLITNHSILIVKWDGFFNREASRVDYNTIDEVGYAIRGFLNTFLRVGNVTIKKMSGACINLNDAWNPKRVQHEITKYQSEFIEEKSFKDHEALKTMLADMITTHQKLKK